MKPKESLRLPSLEKTHQHSLLSHTTPTHILQTILQQNRSSHLHLTLKHHSKKEESFRRAEQTENNIQKQLIKQLTKRKK